MKKLFVASIVLAGALILSKPAHASFTCNTYHNSDGTICKICDLYSPNGDWQGSISSNC